MPPPFRPAAKGAWRSTKIIMLEEEAVVP